MSDYFLPTGNSNFIEGEQNFVNETRFNEVIEPISGVFSGLKEGGEWVFLAFSNWVNLMAGNVM